MQEAEELFRLNLGEAHPKSIHARQFLEMIENEIGKQAGLEGLLTV